MLSHELKLKRAGEHIEAVKVEIDRWLGTDAYTISREIDPQTGDTVRRAKVKGSPRPEISLLIGDAIHNLRSALDHAVYFLAERHLGTLTPEIEGALTFPIAGNENRKGQPSDGAVIYKNLVHRQPGPLDGLPNPSRAFIEHEQPYHWGDGYRYHWLWVVNELDRIDKHRRLAVTTAFLGLQYVTTPEGASPRIKFSRAEGPVKNDDVLVAHSGAEVGVDAHFTRAVAINEVPTRQSEAVACLTAAKARVEWVVQVLTSHV